MKNIEKKFIKPGKISDFLKCPICFEVFQQATRLYCGHTFCANCIKDSTKISNTCPQCRTVVDKKLMGIDLLARSIINDLDVFCSSDDCPWKGKYENLQFHCLQQCIFFGKGSRKGYNKYADFDSNSRQTVQKTINDDQVIDKINENVEKGSLVARVLAKTQSLKDYADYASEKDKETEESSRKNMANKPIKKGKKRIRQIQNQKQEMAKSKSSDFEFLESLFD